MNRFIEKTLKPYLIIFGLITMVPGTVTLNPEGGLQRIFQLSLPAEFTLLVQHWGLMVFLVGLLMVIAAFSSQLVFSIMLFATLEKSAMVCFVLFYSGRSWVSGFQSALVLDGICTIYGLIYFYSVYRKRRE